MKRDYKLFIKDMGGSIDLIERYMKGISEKQFMKNVLLQDAVIRRLEIIGEASRNIPRSLKEKNREIKWTKISQLRDFTTYYYEASLNRIWKVCKEDLPKIKESLKDIELV